MRLTQRLFRLAKHISFWILLRIEPFLLEFMQEDGCLFKLLYWLYTNTRLGQLYVRRDIRAAHRKFRGTGCHSVVIPFTYGHIKIIPVPQLYDNYGYIITDTSTGDAVVIDVSDAAVFQRCLQQYSIKPSAILSTHKHWDHCCGTKDLKAQYPTIEIYGSEVDRPHGTTKFLKSEDLIEVGSLTFQSRMTPGHTHGHTVFVLEEPESLFTGDLLFLAGCGKVFEGTAEAMLESLDFICSFSDSTLIWPGHDYAKNNLRFARDLETHNSTQQAKLSWVYQQIEDRLPTCPSTLGEEKLYNPFLRITDSSMLFNLGLLLIPPPIDAGAESEMASTNSQTDSDSISIMPYFDSVSFHSCVELDATVLPSQSAPNEIKPEPFVTDRAALLEATKVAPVPEIITELEKQRLKLAAFQLIRKRKNRFDKIST